MTPPIGVGLPEHRIGQTDGEEAWIATVSMNSSAEVLRSVEKTKENFLWLLIRIESLF